MTECLKGHVPWNKGKHYPCDSRRLDISNKRFGRLLAIKIVEVKNKHARWLCRCDCGNEIITYSNHLITGHTKSCGCLRSELDKIRLPHYGGKESPTYKHGHTINHKPSLTYRTYQKIISRCENSKNENYKYYGGRGIKMCENWRNSFPIFLLAMGERPNINTEIHRKNRDGDYEPKNCCWMDKAFHASLHAKELWNRRKEIRDDETEEMYYLRK